MTQLDKVIEALRVLRPGYEVGISSRSGGVDNRAVLVFRPKEDGTYYIAKINMSGELLLGRDIEAYLRLFKDALRILADAVECVQHAANELDKEAALAH